MKQYRKKINIEVVAYSEEHKEYVVKNVGSTEVWPIKKEVFETTYELDIVEQLDFIGRLKKETKELCDRADKLHDFKKTAAFYNLPRESKDLLYEQSRIMDKYIQILGKRMELLGIKDFIKEEK